MYRLSREPVSPGGEFDFSFVACFFLFFHLLLRVRGPSFWLPSCCCEEARLTPFPFSTFLCSCAAAAAKPRFRSGLLGIGFGPRERERDRVRDAGSGEVCARMLISAGCMCVCVCLWFNQEVRGVGVSFERKDEKTVVGLFW